MIYGYLRVSTDEQDVKSQQQGVDSFAAKHGWTIDEYITDEGVSGGKDPDKRKLGPLLKRLKEADVVIAAEISRLGRDLYMVMDILHLCMARGCVVYTVKDNFVLGDDIQSKVLAFAFGLAAEIERQMIRQRTKEGLRLRMKMGVLMGRPFDSKSLPKVDEATKQRIIEQYTWGVPQRRLAENFHVDRNTIARWLYKWGVCEKSEKYIEWEKRDLARKRMLYKDARNLCVVELPRDEVLGMIEQDMTIPEIAAKLPQYTYEQIYDTFLCDVEFNKLYRKHGQLRVKKQKK